MCLAVPPYGAEVPASHRRYAVQYCITIIGSICSPKVKHADDLVLLAKEEKVLQDMIDKVIETGR